MSWPDRNCSNPSHFTFPVTKSGSMYVNYPNLHTMGKKKRQKQNIHPTVNLFSCEREHNHLLFTWARMVSLSFNTHPRIHFLKESVVQNEIELHILKLSQL